MKKKKILILHPVTPHPSYNESLMSPLSFLEQDYILDSIDSLTFMEDIPNEAFYHRWEKELMKHLLHYDAFFGFSFGGTILQQCFSLFVDLKKPIVLFSTPTYADSSLNEKLEAVILLCKENKVDDALRSLYKQVYYPNQMPQSHESLNNINAAKRVIFGLTRVLETNARSILKENKVNHLHLIGELSHLVNKDNVIAPQNGTLINVPKAGMRMLNDNLPFCKKVILETLNGETK